MTALSDPRPLLERAVAQAARVVGAVGPDRLDDPTPCTDFDVRQLLGHLLFAARRAAEAGDRAPITEAPDATMNGPADGRWAEAFELQGAALVAAWQRPGALDGEVRLPFGTFPAAVVAWIYAMELVTHAWDLATAVGAADLLEPDLFETVLPFARQILPPEGRGAPELPFAAVVAVPDDVTAPDRLAAHLGRVPVAAGAEGGRVPSSSGRS